MTEKQLIPSFKDEVIFKRSTSDRNTYTSQMRMDGLFCTFKLLGTDGNYDKFEVTLRPLSALSSSRLGGS